MGRGVKTPERGMESKSTKDDMIPALPLIVGKVAGVGIVVIVAGDVKVAFIDD